MTDLPKYHFMPWARRGLAAVIQEPDKGADLPARAPVSVAITVTNVDPASVNLELYGPGDIIGVDPRLIVRKEPHPNITDFEPNYLAAIEFDLPDFPWMFTPARAGGQDRLRPWCVLVVLDQEVVQPPKVNRGAPLPVVTVPAEACKRELPDLSESWAWAHVQVISDNSDVATLEAEMTSQPDLNVSRLVCPRHLEPNHHYMACLVPAFDLGLQRGLGLTPEGQNVKPAWDPAVEVEVRLPLYYHWEFSTGPVGDFESLARKLTPIRASGEIGAQQMFVGAPHAGLPDTPANQERSYLKMNGVLKSFDTPDTSIDDIATAMRAGLRRVLNAPGDLLNGTNQPRIALSPPIYGEWHVNHHSILDTPQDIPWLRELNLDPRTRAAAGLGAEVIRANQEEFMQAAWEQVGDVIKANELLNRARFSRDVQRRTYQRHYVTQPQDRLLQMTSALHGRTLMQAQDATVRARIAGTSLPNASVDPALRRLASPQRSWLKAAARRGGFANNSSRSARSMLVQSLAANRVKVDPGKFTPDSITGTAILDKVKVDSGATQVDLSSLGIQAQVDVDALERMQTTRGDLIKIPPQDIPKMALRSDLSTTGVIVKTQLDILRELEIQLLQSPATEAQSQLSATQFNVPTILSRVTSEALERSDAVAIRVNAQSGTDLAVDALQVDTSGNIQVRGKTIATLDANLRNSSRTELTQVLSELPADTLAVKPETGIAVPMISLLKKQPEGAINLPPITPLPGTGPVGRPPVVVLPPPVKDPQVVTQFQVAFSRMAEKVRLDTPDPLPQFVAFAVKTARDILIARLDPDVMVPRRVKTMIGGEAGSDLESLPGVSVLPAQDRVMVAPQIAAPMYSYLAKYDRERFLPGIGRLPVDSITLLEPDLRFIEAFMVGLNYEMNRELLWREYPSDQRGTTIQKFWNWLDGRNDLTGAIHTWKSGALGDHLSHDGQVVLLLRGQLLRRYPNTIIYAWKAQLNGEKLEDPPAPGHIKEPVFRGSFDPDISFAGFDLDEGTLTKDGGWFFVLQEQPTEPRLGLDEAVDGAANGSSPDNNPTNKNASDLTWKDVKTDAGTYMHIQGNPLNGKKIAGAVFGKNSAHLAYILLQQPMRVAIHGKYMLNL
jgi:hypothetical protein